MFIILISVITLATVLRSGDQAGNVPASSHEHPGPSGKREPSPAPVDRANTTPAVEQGPARATRIAIPGIVFIFLLMVEVSLQLSLRRGWTTYTGSEPMSLLAVDSEGQVWAAGQSSLVTYPEAGEPLRIPLPSELANDPVQSLAMDGAGRIWLGTYGGLLTVRDTDEQWLLFGPEQIESPIIGTEIIIDGQEQAWTNSPRADGMGLARIELRTESRTYTLADAGLGALDTLAVDAQGQLWVLLTNGDLKRLEPDGSWTKVATAGKQDPDVNWAFSPFGNARLAIDRQGQAWVGVGNGVVQVLGSDGAWQMYSPDEAHPTIYTKGIALDGQGYLWGVSGTQGLYRFQPGTGWTAYNAGNSGLPVVHSAATLAADGQGRMWIGTPNGGLLRFDPSQALPAKHVPLLSTLGGILVPAGLIGTAALMIWALGFTSPAALGDLPGRKSWQIAAGSFGAGVCGLYALAGRERIADQLMQAVFGDGWAFADVLSFFVAPALGICVVPLGVAGGAVLGILLARFAARVFHP